MRTLARFVSSTNTPDVVHGLWMPLMQELRVDREGNQVRGGTLRVGAPT